MTRPFIGVPTTTDVAFGHQGSVYLERMNLLSVDGCGVLTDVSVPAGTEVAIAFRLSTAPVSVRVHAKVVGATATTPAGFAVLEKLGQAAFDEAMDVGESATRVVKLTDIKPQQKGKKTGLCLQFVALEDAAKAAIAHHLEVSQKKLAAQPQTGAKWRKQGDIGAAFDEDSNLSDRAKDW